MIQYFKLHKTQFSLYLLQGIVTWIVFFITAKFYES
jgi:hypothetical protein